MKTTDIKPLRIYKASAGSGKTFTLAVEYITLLAINPMEYQHILAVTFTNKATAEMKQRILGTLYGIAHGEKDAESYVERILENLEARRTMPPYQEEHYRSRLAGMNRTVLQQRAKEALSNIIHDYSRFHVETIDSFFQSIVRELANELELPNKMKVELDETEVLSEAIDHIIDNLKEESTEMRTIIDFIEEKIRENQSWQVEETVKEFGRNIFKENYLIHGEDVRKKITHLGTIHQFRQQINAELEKKKEAVTAMGQKMMDTYERCGMNDKDCTSAMMTFLQKVCNDNVKEPSPNNPGTYSDTIRNHITDVDKWFKKSSKQRDTLQHHVTNTLMPMLQQLFDLHDTYVSHLHTVTAIGQHLYSLMLLNEISQTVKQLNEDAGRFLLPETANFLRNMIHAQDIPFIYEKTGAAIKHIMIDEFQDTSTLQWANFRPLVLNSLASDGSCLIVGDVKQSIYRFRNSDWRILNNLGQDEELQSHMGQIPAEFNFRSSRRVVEFNNELFKNAVNILKVDCPDLSKAYGDVEQIAKKDKDEGFVRIENIDYHGIDPGHLPDEWDKGTPKDYEEATLKRLQLSVKELVDNGVKANDITILVRTNKEVPLICEYFNAHQDVLQVKVVSDDAFRLDASPAINTIISALRLLAEPDSALQLATLTHQAGTIPPGFDEQARSAMCFKPLTELVEDIYQIFQLNRMPNQDAYLFFFNDLVEQFCEDNLTDLDNFLRTWDEKLCEKTIPGGAADGVRIMTMHKSKGLEFHSVIIPFCSWSVKPKADVVMWCIPQKDPYSQMPLLPVSVSRAKDDSLFVNDRRDEELRTLVDNINLLYVAFTRAKHNLIILTGNKLDKPASQEFLVAATPKTMEQTDVEGCITISQCGAIVPSQGSTEEGLAALPVSFVSHPSVAEFRQSYESDLFISEDSPIPTQQQHAHRVRLISLGNLYHSIFQHIHTANDVPHAIRLLESKGCFGSLLDAAEAQQTVTQLIADITPAHPEWFSPDWQVLNERAILFLENKMLTSRRPDRVVVNGTQAIIIDYKTAQNAVRRQSDGTFLPPDENKRQIEEYKELLSQIGYTDVKAYLWYILDQITIAV